MSDADIREREKFHARALCFMAALIFGSMSCRAEGCFEESTLLFSLSQMNKSHCFFVLFSPLSNSIYYVSFSEILSCARQPLK